MKLSGNKDYFGLHVPSMSPAATFTPQGFQPMPTKTIVFIPRTFAAILPTCCY